MDQSLSTSPARAPLLHRLRHARRTAFNRMFAAVYFCAILVLLYRHALKLIHSTTYASFLISLSFLVSDTFLAFLWLTRQCFLMTIVYRDEYPENLYKALLLEKSSSDFPALDVFICTTDPYKEPPMRLVSAALSVMAYDYPTERISVYVSDDGGSQVTLFACMEAAKFAYHWLPFCKKNNIIERSPEAYFATNHSSWFFDTVEIQVPVPLQGKTFHEIPLQEVLSQEIYSLQEHKLLLWTVLVWTIQEHQIHFVFSSSEEFCP